MNVGEALGRADKGPFQRSMVDSTRWLAYESSWLMGLHYSICDFPVNLFVVLALCDYAWCLTVLVIARTSLFMVPSTS